MASAWRSRAGLAAMAVLAAGFVLTVALSWPGHLSYDSIVQLHDGRSRSYHSWHPPVMAWLLGLGDAVLRGSGLFVLFDAALLFASLLSLLRLGQRVSPVAAGAALVVVLLPQVLLYQAIVWKDVLFADAAVLGFACLAQAEARWPRGRFAWIAAAFPAFALAALTRQNGAIVLGLGAVALGVIAARRTTALRGASYGVMALLGAGLLVACSAGALALRSDHDEGPVAQLKLLRLYDLIGAVEADPSLPLDALRRDAPQLERLIRSDGVRLYSPQRNDTLVGSQPLQDALADTAPAAMAAQWQALVFDRPGSI